MLLIISLILPLLLTLTAHPTSASPIHRIIRNNQHRISYTDEALLDQIASPLPLAPPSIGAAVRPYSYSNYVTPFNQFSGYLTVNEDTQAKMFYWFVESRTNPVSDRLIIQVSSSSSSSSCSILPQLFEKDGPWRIAEKKDQQNQKNIKTKNNNEGVELQVNPHAWNKLANVLYLENVIGAGFSSADSGYTINTNQTAQDTFTAIQQFFERFPHLRENDFYLHSRADSSASASLLDSSSSPPNPLLHLTSSILSHDVEDLPNFSGFMIGNPSIKGESSSADEIMLKHANMICENNIITNEKTAKKVCDALKKYCSISPHSKLCFEAQESVTTAVLQQWRDESPDTFNSVNELEILQAQSGSSSSCSGSMKQQKQRRFIEQLHSVYEARQHSTLRSSVNIDLKFLDYFDHLLIRLEHGEKLEKVFGNRRPKADDGETSPPNPNMEIHTISDPKEAKEFNTFLKYVQSLKNRENRDAVDGEDDDREDGECTEDAVTSYLNRADVQAALHVTTPSSSDGATLPITRWSACGAVPSPAAHPNQISSSNSNNNKPPSAPITLEKQLKDIISKNRNLRIVVYGEEETENAVGFFTTSATAASSSPSTTLQSSFTSSPYFSSHITSPTTQWWYDEISSSGDQQWKGKKTLGGNVVQYSGVSFVSVSSSITTASSSSQRTLSFLRNFLSTTFTSSSQPKYFTPMLEPLDEEFEEESAY